MSRRAGSCRCRRAISTAVRLTASIPRRRRGRRYVDRTGQQLADRRSYVIDAAYIRASVRALCVLRVIRSVVWSGGVSYGRADCFMNGCQFRAGDIVYT